jgi:hypothetical protein
MSRAVSGSWKGSRGQRPWSDAPGPGYYKEVLRSKAIVTPQRGEFSRAGTLRSPCSLLSYGVSHKPRFGNSDAPTSSVYTLGNIVEFRSHEPVTGDNVNQVVDSIIRPHNPSLLAEKNFSIYNFYQPTWLAERGIPDWRIQLECHTLETRSEMMKVLEARAVDRKPGVKKLLSTSYSAPVLQIA